MDSDRETCHWTQKGMAKSSMWNEKLAKGDYNTELLQWDFEDKNLDKREDARIEIKRMRA